jgi:hypothetical protein
MDPAFEKLTETLHDKYLALIRMPPVRLVDYPNRRPPNIPQSGIYLFSEGDKNLYVGRSRVVPQRVRSHVRKSSGHNAASFAILLARKKTGMVTGGHTRDELIDEPTFKTAFKDAKKQIERMDLRYVEEDRPLRQCLLEVYAAVVARTEFNDFDTH